PWGPYWLVQFCSPAGVYQISVAVSAYDQGFTLTADGYLRFPKYSGSNFRAEGIPVTFNGLPISPERAVSIAYATTHVRVASVPRLEMPFLIEPVQASKWRLVLERP